MEVLAASQTPRSTNWFQGTADAVRQYIWLFEDAMRSGVEDLLILSGTRPCPHALLDVTNQTLSIFIFLLVMLSPVRLH